MRSMLKLLIQASSLRAGLPDVLCTYTSIPPSCSADDATQARSASGSAASTDAPTTLPIFDISATAAATSSALRAQIATDAPSASIVSAMARPRPLVEPVTKTFLP